MNLAINIANHLLSTAMWFIVGRLVLRVFIRDPQNFIWQLFLIATEPLYRASRWLTGGRVPERWLWLVSLAWLLALRVVLTSFYVPAP
jgi:hypothetical protein